MTKPSAFALVSGLLLALSAVLLLSLRNPIVAEYLPYFMWIHVALIALTFYGFWRLHKTRKLSPGGLTIFLRGFPLWLALVAVPVAALAAPLWSESTSSLGQTTNGQPVSRKSWHEEDGRYFLTLNNATPVEISLAEYQSLRREASEVFARGWVLFAYASLVLWQYVARRERASQNAG